MTTPRVALVLIGVASLQGSGGAERHFSDLFEFCRNRHRGRVTMITDSRSVQHLQSAGHLHRTDDIVPLDLGPYPARGGLNILRLTVRLLLQTVGRGFDVVHLCLPTPAYVPYAAVVRVLPRSLRPRIALSVIDCTLAPNLVAGNVMDTYERQVVAAHRLYARWTRLDGIFTWYRAFAEVARRLQLFADGTAIIAAKYCFTDPLHFRPDATRERVVVFAGRLSSQKRPLLFVDAVARLVAAEPELVSGWRFEMYGLGVLEHEVRQRIAAHQLDRVLRLSHSPDLARVFARSRLFVSTQAIENFTSLAMLEAMAAGNAVIAEDVGQTREFVRDGENGLLVTDATPEGFAAAMAQYLRNPSDHERMAAVSRWIAVDVHTIEHAAADITAFWAGICR